MARARPGKVFGVGLNKTGTRSVAQAVRLLGFRTLHKGDRATSDLVEQAHHDGRPLLDGIGGKYDAYFDVEALVRRFRCLDEQYPGSRFILTTRDLDTWVESRRLHVEANQKRAAVGEYTGSFLVVDLDAWVEDWKSHHAAVTSYFADRPRDLLTFDVSVDGWEQLAPFLGQAIPTRPFPWENRAGSGTYRSEPFSSRLRRRATWAWASRHRPWA